MSEIYLCKAEGCNNQALNNSKFCESHKRFIESSCICGEKLKIKSVNYKAGKQFYCRSCNAKMHINKINSSEEGKKRTIENIKAYNSSEKAKINRNKGLNVIHNTYTGSYAHIQQVTSLGLKYGPMEKKKRTLMSEIEEYYS